MSAARCRDQRREEDTTVIEGDSTITHTFVSTRKSVSAAANIYTKRDGAGRRRLCEESCDRALRYIATLPPAAVCARGPRALFACDPQVGEASKKNVKLRTQTRYDSRGQIRHSSYSLISHVISHVISDTQGAHKVCVVLSAWRGSHRNSISGAAAMGMRGRHNAMACLTLCTALLFVTPR